MLTPRQFNLFWITVCLASLLAGQTNTLMAVHITHCCEHQSPQDGPSHTPADHQKDCPYCQFFLNVAVKYITAPVTEGTLSEAGIISRILYTSCFPIQTSLLVAVPRGPPTA